MNVFPVAVERLIEEFAKLPGIGKKSAARLAFFVLAEPKEDAEAFAQAIIDAHGQVGFCMECQNLTDHELCPICRLDSRDAAQICVVSEARDVSALERTREYKGRYHVLHGVLSPMNHVGPDDLRIRELLVRVQAGDIREVIMATNPDTEGDATALYIARLLRVYPEIKVTRLAYGIPMGGHLEYADEITLMHALEGRREI